MVEQRKFQAIKGVRDILPPESALWNRVEQTAREVFATYGYGEIRLPIFEQTELFARSVGQDTDIVSKEMYSLRDKRPAGRIYWAIPLDIESANEIMDDYITKWKEDWERGAIPRSSMNREALDRLSALRGSMPNLAAIVLPGLVRNPELLNDLLSLMASACGVELGDSLTLRPEATASVCRAYIEHGMHTLPGNVKLYYIGPMFRRERPQKGRYRQFYQIGAEVLGQSDAPAIDAEVIEMLLAFFDRCGLAGYETHLNSIGCKECRPAYVAKLKAALIEHINELKADSQRRVETNPLRVLDSKLPEEQAVIEKLPRITEHLCEACREHYAEVKKQLALRGVAYQENWRLVRGLDYYMRTTFEITAPGLGSQNAVCGGGRYDGLVELLGGQPTKGIGFAIGTDRLILSLQQSGKLPSPQGADVLIAWKEEGGFEHALRLARVLRDLGMSVEMPMKKMEPREGLSHANKAGIPVAVFVGANEVTTGTYSMKMLSEGMQVSVLGEKVTQLGRLLLYRILLERAIIQLAKHAGIDATRIPPQQLLAKLLAAGVFPAQLLPATKLAFEVFNKAAHGADIPGEEQIESIGRALFVLMSLSKEYGESVFR